MEKEFIEQVLIEAINYTADEDGWANLAELGGILRENGIHYGKLTKFLSHFDYLVEVIEEVWRTRDKISGYHITYQPQFLRHFTCHFEPIP